MSNRDTLPVIFGLGGTELSAAERRFFRASNPLGFILFARNCRTPDQLRRLVGALREALGRSDAPVLIDQEGGRVARLAPPYWPVYPAAARIAALGGTQAREAAWLGARLIADDLGQLGISVDCMPVLDVPAPDADPIIGDRAYGSDPATVSELGRVVCEGLLAGGVLPVIKHVPGHGRSAVDSHLALPRVTASLAELDSSDFAPFRALNTMPWAMTAHILYTAIDPENPATLSARLIAKVIRAGIGFDGVLISDDLSMQALGGGLADRARAALAAGCDVALHCNGHMEEMTEIANAIGPIAAASQRRIDSGEVRRGQAQPFDRCEARWRFDALLAGKA